MPIPKRKWFRVLFLVLWLALTTLLLCFSPARENSMDFSVSGWRYLRLASQALAITVLTAVIFLLAYYQRKLRGFLPAFIKYQPLLSLLVRRDFLTKYKRSVLGILWSLLSPLANMIILSVVFSSLFRVTIPYFPAYVLSGTVLFACFTESTQGALISVTSSTNLIRKVYLPKYIFPLSKTITGFVNLFFSLLALVVVMVFVGAPFHPSVAMVPVILVYLLLFCSGVGLLLATAFTFFRDTAHLYGIVLTAMNYLSAIFFDISIVPEKVVVIFAVNPMYHYVRVFRSAMLYGGWPTPLDHLLCAGMALTALCAGIFIFYRKQDQFILHL